MRSGPPEYTSALASGAKAPDVTVMAVVAAVGTILGAFQLFPPKFAIGRAMKRETGRVETGFRAFYTIPQWIVAGIVLAVWLILFAAVLHQLAPTDALANNPLVQRALAFLALQNLIPLLLAAVVMAGVIQMNVLSWVFLFVGWAVSMLPFRRTVGVFGPDGRSAGWLQAWCICTTWDKGQPLLISPEEVERVGYELLRKLSSPSYIGENFAAKPANASAEGAANIALFGCILEEAHYANRWTVPTAWKDFYAALEEINTSKKLFEPTQLLKFPSGQAFSQTLRDALAECIKTRGHPVPDDNYYGAAAYVARSWDILKRNKGSSLKILPFCAGLIGSKLYWLNRHLAKFPLLRGDGMRQQAIKLMTRWDVTPWAKEEDFLQPFAKRQAWLLLQEGVLKTFAGQQDVTFWTRDEVGVAKIACRRIFDHVKRTADGRTSAEATAVSERFPAAWDLCAAADYTLWNWATEQLTKAKAADWKGSRWKLDDERASRVK